MCNFKLGALLKQARIEAGLTQKQIADQLHTTKSVISRMENHAKDIRLSTLEKFAKAVGRDIQVADWKSSQHEISVRLSSFG